MVDDAGNWTDAERLEQRVFDLEHNLEHLEERLKVLEEIIENAQRENRL